MVQSKLVKLPYLDDDQKVWQDELPDLTSVVDDTGISLLSYVGGGLVFSIFDLFFSLAEAKLY